MPSTPLLLTFLACCAFAGCTAAPPAEHPRPGQTRGDAASAGHPDLARHFAGVEGTFVLLDPQRGRTLRHDPERAGTRFLPASTFKIPNTLVALETGVVDGPDFALVWDSAAAPRQDWWPAVWAREHTLRTALPASVVWYYQTLARRIGADRMRAHLRTFGYGNADVSGGIDRFWLDGGLRISADEQVEFLQRFYHGGLGVSPRSTEIARALLVLEEADDYRLSGKTGWAGPGDPATPDVGWLVGYLERGPEVYFYAINLDIRENADAGRRLAITRAIFQDLGLMEGG
jgi:beta-lactamase class D